MGTLEFRVPASPAGEVGAGQGSKVGMCMVVWDVGHFLLKEDLQVGWQSLKSALSQICLGGIFLMFSYHAEDMTSHKTCLDFSRYIPTSLRIMCEVGIWEFLNTIGNIQPPVDTRTFLLS
jgi:hypothetical protein